MAIPSPPEVAIVGHRVTTLRQPLFRIRLRRRDRGRLRRSEVTFVCRIGRRASTRSQPCGDRFRAPDIGPGRHVLVIQAIGANGERSRWLKFPYFVRR